MYTRTLVCTIAGLIAVALLILATPKIVLLPRGIARPAEKTYPAISPDNVMIYPETPAANVEVLGQISIEQGFDTLNESTKNLLIQKIKTLAAGLGANGVVVNTLIPVQGLRRMLEFRGTAILVPAAGSKQQ